MNGAISAAIQRASLLWCVALGLYAANEVAVDVFLPLSWYTGVGRLLEVVVVLSVTVILAGISSFATACVGHVRNGAVNGFVQTTAFVVTLVAGALVVLSL
ncbi:MAG TPA: hypothetical protein VMS64_26645 [Candidatus Methylomirabilis sp.]|nr:hypothetical protein [Candidatus Methylomirabilis sp.]